MNPQGCRNQEYVLSQETPRMEVSQIKREAMRAAATHSATGEEHPKPFRVYVIRWTALDTGNGTTGHNACQLDSGFAMVPFLCIFRPVTFRIIMFLLCYCMLEVFNLLFICTGAHSLKVYPKSQKTLSAVLKLLIFWQLLEMN